MSNATKIVLVVLVAALLLAGALFWPSPQVSPPVSAVRQAAIPQSKPAVPSTAVQAAQQVATPVQQIMTYPPTVKKKLNLPAEIEESERQQVIASNTVDSEDRPQTVTTVVDLDSGQSQTFVQAEPLPAFQWDHNGEAGMAVGVRNITPVARLHVSKGLFDVKAVRVALTAEADFPIAGYGKPEVFAGVSATYRW